MANTLPPLIINVRINEWTLREPNPYLPYSPHIPYAPQEIAADAAACVREGAAIIHYHARDPNTGAKSMDLGLYRDTIRLIKQETGALVMPTLGMDSLPVDRRIENLVAMRSAGDVMPELVPIDVISCNLDVYLKGAFSETDEIYENTPRTWKYLARKTTELGMKPVPILWDVGSVRSTEALVEMGLLRPPLFCEVALTEGGLLSGHPGTVKGLQAILDFFPPRQDWLWTVLVWGSTLLPLGAVSISLGGHVSIGLGDYHYPELGFPRNADLVRRVKQIAAAIGRPVATPSEARKMLGIR